MYYQCTVECICMLSMHTQFGMYRNSTVLPAKSDSDVMFCLQIYQGLIIDRSRVYLSYPADRINTLVIYRFTLAQVECNS